MNIHECTYILTIAESESLSQASKKLGISQPALSKFLHGLEKQLGTELFVRNRGRLYITPAGRIYIKYAKEFISVKNNILIAIKKYRFGELKNLKIISTPYRGAEILSKVFGIYSSLYPDIELDMDEAYSAAQEEIIHNNSADFACGSGIHSDYGDVKNIPITKEELFIAVPSFHPLAKYAGKNLNHIVSMPLRVFKDTPFVLPSRKSNIRLIADSLFKKEGFSPVIAFESVNNITVDSMLTAGMGVGFISARYVKMNDKLVYFRLDPVCSEITYLRCRAERVLKDFEAVLCGIIIDRRLSLPFTDFISNEESLHCLASYRNFEKG